MTTSLCFTHFLAFPRCNIKGPVVGTVGLMLFTDHKSQSKWVLSATSKHGDEGSIGHENKPQKPEVTKKTRTKRTTTRGRKKANTESELLVSGLVSAQEGSNQEDIKEESEKPKRRPRTKVTSDSSGTKEATPKIELKRGRKSQKDLVEIKEGENEAEVSDTEDVVYLTSDESDDADIDLELQKGDQEDISFTYVWPPLVCCFGAAQHAFLPCGRPANRLINHEIHASMKDAYWAPEKFTRAPGSTAASVALALAKLGGRVAFMGKVGGDDLGSAMVYYLNANNVQTRSVSIDSKRLTAASQMKVIKRGKLRTTSVKPCAEDSLSKSEINIDVLREAKMFYVNSFSLLDPSMRKTTLWAIKIARKLGQVIFFDVNLPLPLWESVEETKSLIEQVWNFADFIEVTKQELEFLCGIKPPSEEFDTKNNKKSKFVHYESDVIAPLWHENLKVLFVSNGTSKLHYYTKDDEGFLQGAEDAPLTPFTQDMSASGDGIVAALMRMLTVQPHLITDKGYLERSVKYALSCGVIDQWIVARQQGFPPIEGLEYEDEETPDPNGLRSITERDFRTVRRYDKVTPEVTPEVTQEVTQES